VRNELNVPPGAKIDLLPWTDADPETWTKLRQNNAALARLARVQLRTDNLDIGDQNANVVIDNVTYVLPLRDVIDLEEEKGRLQKNVTAAEKERDSLAARLANPNFTERAKPEAVEKARADHEAKAAEAERLRAALERLG
jgi:valyl-tRNA synthetase